jgi:hypothetical protein
VLDFDVEDARNLETLFPTGTPGHQIFGCISAAIEELGASDVHVTKSEAAFRRRRGFAYVWRPGQYVNSAVPAVLSIVLPSPLESARFKQIVQPSPNVWMHHLELNSPQDVDQEVRHWLAAAFDAAR